MRPGISFNATSLSAVPMPPHLSPWHSPVPYLFGGLATMLGLIAFALLLLACSYWRLSRNSEENDPRHGVDGGEKQLESIKVRKEFEDQVVVIMAGDQKPTFLATPISGTASAFPLNKETVIKSFYEEDSEKKQSEELQNQSDENQ